jgi:hypothetical protein
VNAKDVRKFHAALTSIIRVHLDGLKKKERAKKVK